MKHHEHAIQVGIVKYLRAIGVFCFAVPNGGKRDAKTGAYLKDEGALAGVADLIVVMNDVIVFIEIKTDKGKQSESQRQFQEEVEKRGHLYLIWRSIDDAINFKMVNK